MADLDESSESDPVRGRSESTVPDLERRRGEPKQDATDLERRRAIYLIEREAIELRRLRWVEVRHSHLRPPDIAAPAPGGELWEPEREREFTPEDRARLATYNRPPPPEAGEPSPSRMRRVGSWLKSLFLGE